MQPKTASPVAINGNQTQALPVDQLADFSHFDREELESLVLELQQSKADLEAKRFVEAGLSRFASLLRWRTEDSLQEWAGRILEELVVSIGGLQACLYMTTQNAETKRKELHLAATYAFEADDVKQVINFGEGIIGQAAQSGRQLHFANMADTFATRSYTSLAIFYPRSLLIQPLIYNDNVEGIIELSSVSELGNREMELVRNLSENLAATLMSVRSQEAMKQLYRDAQEKAEALLAGEEEMRQNLEELEATQEEMRRVQGELEEKQRLITGVIANIPNTSLLVFNHQFRYELVGGDDLLTRAGFNVEGIRNSSLREYWGDEIAAEYEPIYQKVLNGESFSLDTLSGDIWFYMHFFPVRSSDGQVLYGVVLMQDITEQKQQAMAIQESEYKLNRAMEVARMGYWEMDLVSQKINASDRLLEIHGRTAADFGGNIIDLGTFIGTLFHPEDAAKLAAESIDTTPDGEMKVRTETAAQQTTSEYRSIFPDGSIHNMISRFEMVLDDAGNPIAMRGATQDITEQKRAEEELRSKTEQLAAQEEEMRQNLEELEASQDEMRRIQLELEDRYRLISGVMANIPKGSILVFNRELRYIIAEGAEQMRLAGLDIDKMRGNTIYDALDPGMVPMIEQQYKTVLAGEMVSFEMQVAQEWYLTQVAPVKGANGEIQYGVVLVLNISERKLFEQQLAAQEEELRQNLEELEATQEEMRRAQQELEENQKLLRGVITNIPNGSILVFDTDLRYIIVEGRKALKAVGLDPDTMEGKTIYEALPEQVAKDIEGQYHTVLSGTPVVFEYQMGDTWFFTQISPINNAEGKAIYGVVLTQIITERKKMEIELEERNRTISTVMGSIPNGFIAVFDHDLRYVMVEGRDALAEMGKSPEMMIGRTLYDIWPPAVAAAYDPIFRNVLAGNSLKTEYLDEERSNKWSQVLMNPVRNAAGEVIYGVLLTQDIHERKMAEMALAESEKRLNRAMEIAAMGNWEMDLVNQTLTMSDRALAIHGRTAEQMGGYTFDLMTYMQNFMHPEDAASLAQSMAESAERGDTVQDAETTSEYRTVFPDGSIHYMLSRFEFVMDDQGNPIRLVGATQDITEQKRAALENQTRIERNERQETALQALTKSADLSSGDLDKAFELLTKSLSEALGVQQVGVWRYTGKVITDLKSYNSLDDKYTSGVEFASKDIPGYFKAIAGGDVLISNEVWSDPRLNEFIGYFAEHNISSMLDVPIRRGGKLWGILCLEHCGESRTWRRDEVRFAGSIADLATLAIEAADRVLKDQETQSLNEELRQNLEELEATQEEMRRAQVEIGDFRTFINSTLNSSAVMFIATDAEGMIKYWNDAAVKLLGYTREEIIDKLTPAVFHELDEIINEAGRLSQEYNDNVEPGFGVFTYLPFKGHKYEREWTYIHKDGTKFPVKLSISAWKRTDGSVGGLLGVATDIREEKAADLELLQAQEALAKHLSLTSGLLNNLPQTSFLVYDHDMRYAMVSGHDVLRQVGLEPDFMMGRTLYDCWPELMVQEFEGLQKGVLSGQTFEFEYPFMDQVYFLKLFPVRDTQDRIVYGATSIQNITEQKATQAAATEGTVKLSDDEKENKIVLLAKELEAYKAREATLKAELSKLMQNEKTNANAAPPKVDVPPVVSPAAKPSPAKRKR